jgi:hypothetical protein
MPVKKRPGKARAVKITPEAVEAYRTGSSYDVNHALHLPPWFPPVFTVDEPHPPADVCEAWRDPWAEVWEIRQALDEAVSDA